MAMIQCPECGQEISDKAKSVFIAEKFSLKKNQLMKKSNAVNVVPFWQKQMKYVLLVDVR